PRDLVIRQCGFENNGVCHLDIQACIDVTIDDTDFLHSTAAAPSYPITKGVKLGGSGVAGQVVTNVEITRSFIRNNTNSFVQFSLGSDSSYCAIRQTRWDVLSGAGAQRFSIDPASLLPVIEDDGYAWPRPTHTNSVSAAGGDSYTPDANQYSSHLIT